MPRAEGNTSRTLGNATMEKCECPHCGGGLAWQGLSLTWSLGPPPTWSLLCPAPGLGSGLLLRFKETEVGPQAPSPSGWQWWGTGTGLGLSSQLLDTLQQATISSWTRACLTWPWGSSCWLVPWWSCVPASSSSSRCSILCSRARWPRSFRRLSTPVSLSSGCAGPWTGPSRSHQILPLPHCDLVKALPSPRLSFPM